MEPEFNAFLEKNSTNEDLSYSCKVNPWEQDKYYQNTSQVLHSPENSHRSPNHEKDSPKKVQNDEENHMKKSREVSDITQSSSALKKLVISNEIQWTKHEDRSLCDCILKLGLPRFGIPLDYEPESDIKYGNLKWNDISHHSNLQSVGKPGYACCFRFWGPLGGRLYHKRKRSSSKAHKEKSDDKTHTSLSPLSTKNTLIPFPKRIKDELLVDLRDENEINLIKIEEEKSPNEVNISEKVDEKNFSIMKPIPDHIASMLELMNTDAEREP